MKTALSIYHAKTHFSEIISEVERTGVHVVIYRHKVPVAEIVPLGSKSDPLVPDLELKGALFVGDPTAPLSAEDWPEGLR
jgi:antitoxin (DNA-binding transcriptional repressor) of toxin-antitoxin stability system